jgi:RNA polymerase sigma-B factor
LEPEVSDLNADYTIVTDMFRVLGTLDEGSVAHRRQRDAIIERALPLADHVARRFRGRGQPHGDLRQVACVGLVNAVNRFDPDAGSDFLAFAVPTIMGEVRRHFRDFGWALKVPRRLKDLQLQVGKAREHLTQEIGRAPTASEIADYLGIDCESVVQVTVANRSYSTFSTDAYASSNDERRSVGSTLGGDDPGFEKVLDVQTVRPLIAALPESERTALRLRFFGEMTQTQIAERMGYSQMHVSRLLARGLDRLRSQILEPSERSAAPSASPRLCRKPPLPVDTRERTKPARLAS